MKPIYVCQNNDFTKSNEELERWIEACLKEARRKGARYVRCTAHPMDEMILLIEGFYSKPPKKHKPKFVLQ